MNGITSVPINDSTSCFYDEVLAHQITLGFFNHIDPCLLSFKFEGLTRESALIKLPLLPGIGLDRDNLRSHDDTSFIEGSGIYALKANKVKFMSNE